MRALKPLGYLLVFVVPALMPFSAWLIARGASPDLAAWFPIFFLFVLLPTIDYAVGRDGSNPADEAAIARLEGQVYFRVLTWLCLPVQVALVLWSAWAFAHLPLGPIGLLGWLLSQGVVSGVLGINVAHELIHKRARGEAWAGGLMLSTVCYGGFKIEHVRGHHVHVSTPEDASSAPFGASVYGFIGRALIRNTRNAWRLEAQRLSQLGLPALHWRNEWLWWTAISASFAVGLGLWLGATGVVFFLTQSLFAALSLEIINYVEHYGLRRQRLSDGRYERPTHLHSWNSNYLISNWMLFQLQRHSDHHEHARRRYQALVHYEASPQLPGGYSAMFVLALVPPLWHRIIDPRVRAFEAQRSAA